MDQALEIDQILTNAVRAALVSADENIIQQLWAWAGEQGFSDDAVSAKFDQVLLELESQYALPGANPVAHLPAAPVQQVAPPAPHPSSLIPHHTPSTQKAPPPAIIPPPPPSSHPPRVIFPNQTETPERPTPEDGPHPDETVRKVVETYGHFGIKIAPLKAEPVVEGPRVRLLRFEPEPTAKSLITPTIMEKLVINAGLHPKHTIVRPQPGCLEIQVPRRRWEPWRLLDHVRARRLTATGPFVLPFGVGIDCKMLTSELIHALIGGTTQSGKTSFGFALACSAMLWYPPTALRTVFLDPTLAGYHQYFQRSPWNYANEIVTDSHEAVQVINNLLAEHRARFKMFASAGVTRIEEYNKKFPRAPLPRIMVFPEEVYALKNPFIPGVDMEEEEAVEQNKIIGRSLDNSLIRGAQETAKTGIHWLPSTQKPTQEAVPTTLRDSLPMRIALKVASTSNSQTILGDDTADGKLAKYLQGEGDMLIWVNGELERAQSYLVEPDEILEIIQRGIEHYGEWAPPRMARKEGQNFFSHAQPAPVAELGNALDSERAKYQQYLDAKARTRSQGAAFAEVFGGSEYKKGKKFYEAKAQVQLWAKQFGGEA